MLKGWPLPGTSVRTLHELQTTSHKTLAAGTEGKVVDYLTGDRSTESPEDLFLVRFGDRGPVQILRTDIEEVDADD
jgi:hypothetical protein